PAAGLWRHAVGSAGLMPRHVRWSPRRLKAGLRSGKSESREARSVRRILYLAAGLLLAVETSNAAPAQNSVPDALAHTPDVNRAFPAPPPTRKAWTERLFEGVTEELAVAGERAAGIAKGTREGIRGLLQA